MGPKRRLSGNKEYCKRYREKNSKKYKENDALRKRYTRMLTKTTSPLLHEEQKKKNRERMRLYREKKRDEKENIVADEESAFSTKQSRARSLKRAEDGLPSSPNKKMEVIGSLAKKYKVRIALCKKRGRKYEDLSEEKVNWLKNYLERPEMTYINPGKKDNVYVGKVDGKSMYVQKQYLLWTLRDTLDIINGSKFEGGPNNEASFPGTFEKKLSFAKLYNFFKAHKQYIWNKNIPESSCLCEICKNACLLAKGINKHLKFNLPTTPHGLVEKFSCSRESTCMNNTCLECVEPLWNNNPELTDNNNDNDDIDDDDGDDDDDDGDEKLVTFYRWGKVERTQKICLTMNRDETWVTWREVIHGLKRHIHRKRQQVPTY